MATPSASRLPGVRKIAVLRANGLGDLIFALPALQALRRTYPQAEIVLLAKAWHADFWRDRPGPVNRVEVTPAAPGVGEPEDAALDDEQRAELDRFFERMAGEHFDLAVQMHGGGRFSNPFIRGLGAYCTIGLKSPDAVELDRWAPYVYFQNEVLRCLEIVSLAGAPACDLEPRVCLTAADMREAEQVLASLPRQEWVALEDSLYPPMAGAAEEDPRPLVILNAGAGDGRRRWPTDKFAVVGDRLAARGARIALTGTAGESELVGEIVDRMRAPAENLCGRLTLGGLAGVLARAAVVISNDTGPLHLAGAVGAPTVGIYWCGNLINAGPLTCVRHRQAISWQLDCPVCGLNCIAGACDHHESFVSGIPADEVTASALDLLG